MPDYDPIPVLQSVGYTEREAAFLYLVALHSGYFLRRQYGQFISRERGAIAEQLLRKAATLGHLQSIACGQARSVYHLASKQMYEAVGLTVSQHRRVKGDAEIKRRLMVLDFVLDHLGETLLDSAESKTGFFVDTLGLGDKVLPRLGALLFPEEFPILLGAGRTVRFTFVDEGALSNSGLKTFLRRHRALFGALPGFELLYIADSDHNFERVGKVFAALFPARKALGMTALTPRGVDHFLEYLHARESYDTRNRSIPLRDLEVLHEGEFIYTTLEHQALYAAWKIGSTSAEKIRQRFHQQGPLAKFTAIVLPYRFPLFQFRQERNREPGLGSSQRSRALPFFEEQVHE
ncbi:MAG: hypothetical protein WBQ94_13885 [Terracidiphilus sp.]